jgi:hypothetical protein
MNPRQLKIILGIAVVFLIASCASQYQDASIQDPYGFFSGIWHGLIFPFSFIGWLVIDDVYVIGQPNTGGTYIIGFILGVICIFGSLGSS